MTTHTQDRTIHALIAGDDDRLFAAFADGLYQSADSGANWQSLYNTLDESIPRQTTALALAKSTRQIFAGVPGGILRSVDGGMSWDYLMLADPLPVVSALLLSPTFDSDGTVLAATIEDGIYRSETEGRHWQPANFGLLDFGVYALAVSPDYTNDSTIYAGTESGIFISTNGGRAWRETPFPMDAAPVLCLTVTADGTVYAGTESTGLWLSSNRGDSWGAIASGAPQGAINQLVPLPQGNLVLMNDALYLSSSDNWQQITTYMSLTQVCHSPTENTLLVASIDGDIIKVAM